MTAISVWKWGFKEWLKDECQKRIKEKKLNLHNVCLYPLKKKVFPKLAPIQLQKHEDECLHEEQRSMKSWVWRLKHES